MGRKSKYSKEVKIRACIDYEKGNVSFSDIAREIGTAKEVVHRWYLKYKEHGASVFEPLNKERSYSRKSKLLIIEEYTSGKYSQSDLAAKYNISTGLISNWVNKWYNGMEIEDYDPKGGVYTMKSRKTTFEERLEIVKWVIENDMSYKNAADKYSITYALVYK
ncbi:MAG: transposase [Epulopiscium sp.]|nr:transposase [Candidatus Epulonipiscium sp.]